MSKGTYSQGKRQRESDKERKKRDKAARRERQGEQGPAGFEIASAEEVVGNMPSTSEAMRRIEERAQAPRAAVAIPCKLFVGDLSYATVDAGLHQLFSKFGVVLEAVVVNDYKTGQSRGFGFVTFENRRDGAKAVESLNGAELDGRNIVVNVATTR